MTRKPRQSPAASAAAPPVPDGTSCVATLVHRKYTTDLRPQIPDEFSARIEYEGQHAFFPLAEDQRVPATRKAESIRKVVEHGGWPAAAKFVREFTLAIFWLPNPLTCTYATLFTAPEAPPAAHPLRAPRVRVVLYEPDEDIRRGLLHWLSQVPDYECLGAHDSPAAFLKQVARVRPDLALFDEPPCTPTSEHLQSRLAAASPEQVGFPFGIYRDSEHAWYCVTGVDGGYYYRRRRPAQILEPFAGLWQASQPGREAVELQIRSHVQTLFGLRAAAVDAFPGLTQREREVLLGLRRGHTDKSLASQLGVSVWTVHTHMKSIFEKLGVHTRAEAVAKCFEK